MKGIVGDAIIIAIVIAVILLATYRLWYPTLRRRITDIRRDMEDAHSDGIDKSRR